MQAHAEYGAQGVLGKGFFVDARVRDDLVGLDCARFTRHE
jgi:hypothetical protein